MMNLERLRERDLRWKLRGNDAQRRAV